jgi:sugar-specific transcriptional regulator TrmB
MPSAEFFSLLRRSGQFDDLEIKILQSMYKLENRGRHKINANEISKEADISVTNAYKYLYSLEEKGIVESSVDKNKVFWLSKSSNPFPRLLSRIGKDYVDKKELFARLKELYDELIPQGHVWAGEKVSEPYRGNFSEKTAFLMDSAKEEILIISPKFYDDVMLLEAMKRAVQRGINIRIIAGEINPVVLENLRKIKIEMRLGRTLPYLVLVDNQHGITIDEDDQGVWFMNCKTNYREEFENLWNRSQTLR